VEGRTLLLKVRPWVRAIHRDLGYVAVGLTFVYAISGLAVNHIADWDPNFQNTTRELDVKLPSIDHADDEIAATVATSAGISGKPKEVYREGDDLEVLYERRTLHVNLTTGHVLEERQEPRFFVRVANWLHLNRGKKAWKYFADAYAAGLLLLASTGLFMIPGKKGLVGRGAVFVAIGVAIPVLYVTLSHGP
jgi:uncharacterized protein